MHSLAKLLATLYIVLLSSNFIFSIKISQQNFCQKSKTYTTQCKFLLFPNLDLLNANGLTCQDIRYLMSASVCLKVLLAIWTNFMKRKQNWQNFFLSFWAKNCNDFAHIFNFCFGLPCKFLNDFCCVFLGVEKSNLQILFYYF